ncbi:Fungal Zn(2)-Cys(6) binuclear cluster domain [Ceratobasidium sp. AG-Ba]|nr:Fungal Zn(2)-Cys(6) binuclear cluster domain [Ceratobasidium sp. AG-Ba]
MSPVQLDHPQLLDVENHRLVLHGIHVNDKLGPRFSDHPIAKCKLDDSGFWSNRAQEQERQAIEVTRTENSHDSNYAHCGWSTAALSKSTPWIKSRIAYQNQYNESGLWTTKMIATWRLSVNITVDDILPVPGFRKDIEASLNKPTDYERFQGLNAVFERWGDVIAMRFELGTSIAVTDASDTIEIQREWEQYFNMSANLRLEDMSGISTARIRIKGGNENVAPEDVAVWLSDPVPAGRWAQIRVSEVVPVTELLPENLQVQVQSLYARLFSYLPEPCRAISAGYTANVSEEAWKTIRQVNLVTSDAVESLCVEYRDGTLSHEHGDYSGRKPAFSLREDEFIVEVTAWLDDQRIYGLQFNTSKGRVSHHFGGSDGRPTILTSYGGALVDLPVETEYNEQYGIDLLRNIKTVWRHDLLPLESTVEQICTDYVGGTGGEPFIDWEFLKNSTTAHVSCLRIRSGSYVHAIQITNRSAQATYRGVVKGRPFVSPSWSHGGAGGLESTFQLGPDEYITAVWGRHDGEKIIQLNFKTDEGRTSEKYGRTSGKSFMLEAPMTSSGKHTRLRCILGKSSQYLNGIIRDLAGKVVSHAAIGGRNATRLSPVGEQIHNQRERWNGVRMDLKPILPKPFTGTVSQRTILSFGKPADVTGEDLLSRSPLLDGGISSESVSSSTCASPQTTITPLDLMIYLSRTRRPNSRNSHSPSSRSEASDGNSFNDLWPQNQCQSLARPRSFSPPPNVGNSRTPSALESSPLMIHLNEVMRLLCYSIPVSVTSHETMKERYFLWILGEYETRRIRKFFRPMPPKVRTAIISRVRKSGMYIWSAYLGANVYRSLDEKHRGGDVQPYMYWIDKFDKQVEADRHRNPPIEVLEDRLAGLLELAFLKFIAVSSSAGYSLLQRLLPLFIQVVASEPSLWSERNGLQVSLPRAFGSFRYEIRRFVFYDTMTAIVFGFAPLVQYDVSDLDESAQPFEWVHGIPMVLLAAIIQVATWRATCPEIPNMNDWRELEIRTLGWKPKIDELIGDDSVEVVSRLGLQECWRHAILIYIYMAMCCARSDDTRVQYSVDQIIRLMTTVVSDSVDIHLFVPCIVAGVAARYEHQRAAVQDKLESFYDTRVWLCRGIEFVPVLEHLWHGAARDGAASTVWLKIR